MFEYVLNLVYNLPKSKASVVYAEMTDKPNEIRLGNVFSCCLLFSFSNNTEATQTCINDKRRVSSSEISSLIITPLIFLQRTTCSTGRSTRKKWSNCKITAKLRWRPRQWRTFRVPVKNRRCPSAAWKTTKSINDIRNILQVRSYLLQTDKQIKTYF